MIERETNRRTLFIAAAAAAVGAISWKDALSQGGQDNPHIGLETASPETSNVSLISKNQLPRVALRTTGQFIGPFVSILSLAVGLYHRRVNENSTPSQVEAISK